MDLLKGNIKEFNMNTDEILEELMKLKAARNTILEGGQEYRLASRSLVRANLADINREINKLEMRLEIAKNGGLSHSNASFGLI